MAATLVVTLVCAAVYTGIVVYNYDPDTFLFGDSPYYAAASASLIGDHDLKLRNNLRGSDLQHASSVAIGADGEWRPKHPVLMSVVAIPFLLVFGVKGLLVLNVTVMSALAALCHRMGLRASPAWAASAATITTALFSFVVAYAYNYSPDAFAALPAVASVLLLWGSYPLLAGLLAGAAFAAKPAHVVFLAVALIAAWARGGRREALRFAGGIAPWVVAIMVYNLVLFGGVATFGYDRIFDPGAPGGITTQRADFSLRAIPENFVAQIVDSRRGLLATAPSVLLALAGLPFLFARDRTLALFCAALSVAYLTFFSSYLPWMASSAGNRFLFVPVLLSAVPLAALFDRLGRIGDRGPIRVVSPSPASIPVP
jgi:hypothetical protein